MNKPESWKMKTLLIGAGAGLVVGLLAGLIFIQRTELNESTPNIAARDGVLVGIGVLGVLRSIADLGTKK
jgi:xanthosine utilization system XapX-like protein